ncbi:GTP-binding protein [Streptomyces sp. NPDC100445]|uniref:GTP-binding protein n=1 Tax=Streptomyces sp. NPDC100445 TaxID=3366102 RepID=UPI0037FBFA07
MGKGLLSVVVGNTPGVRGAVVDQLLRLAPRAVVLAVSIQAQAQGRGYPTVQRFLYGSGAALPGRALQGATGDPVVILRQDLLSLRRSPGAAHVVLALPDNVDALPLLVELWRPRVSSGSLGDHYDAAPVVVGIDTESFMADIGCVHRTERLWSGGDQGESVTPAEAAARQVEAADALIVPRPAGSAHQPGGAELLRQLNGRALLMSPVGTDGAARELPVSLVHALPKGADEEWRSRLEPVVPPRPCRDGGREVRSLYWHARRPLHPERLTDALAVVMSGVVRGRGHLWLCSRPDAVVTWRSAGAYLELREADRWLEEDDPRGWQTASPQRRTLASWYWHDYYGERRNEITLTGVALDQQAVRSALDRALLTDVELSRGRRGWTSVPDPLLGDLGGR